MIQYMACLWDLKQPCNAVKPLKLPTDVHDRFGPYFVSPVVAGLEPQKDGSWKPFLCGTDSIGAIEKAHDFMLAGTAPESLYGMCESMWRPDLVSCLT